MVLTPYFYYLTLFLIYIRQLWQCVSEFPYYPSCRQTVRSPHLLQKQEHNRLYGWNWSIPPWLSGSLPFWQRRPTARSWHKGSPRKQSCSLRKTFHIHHEASFPVPRLKAALSRSPFYRQVTPLPHPMKPYRISLYASR